MRSKTTRCAIVLTGALCGGCAGGSATDAVPETGLRWELATPGGLPLAIVADAPWLFVAQKQGGVLVLRADAAGAEATTRIPTGQFGGLHATALALHGTRLFVGLGDFFDAQGSRTGLAVVDVSDPARPAVDALWVSAQVMTGTTALLVDAPHVYLAAKRDGILVFDAAQPDTVRLVGSILPDVHFPKANPSATEHPNARGLARAGNLLYVANDAGGLRVIDIADPTAPRELAKYINAGAGAKPQAYNGIVLNGGVGFATLDYCGLEVLDVSNPLDIRQIGWWNPWACQTAANTWFNSPGHTNQIVLDAARSLAHVSAGASELVVIDVSDPAQPALYDQYEHPSGDQAVWGIAVTPTETYLAYITAFIPFRGTWAGVKAVTTIR